MLACKYLNKRTERLTNYVPLTDTSKTTALVPRVFSTKRGILYTLLRRKPNIVGQGLEAVYDRSSIDKEAGDWDRSISSQAIKYMPSKMLLPYSSTCLAFQESRQNHLDVLVKIMASTNTLKKSGLSRQSWNTILDYPQSQSEYR